MRLSGGSADLVEAGRTPGRRRCIRCSSSVCGARTPSPSGSPAPRRLSPAASGVAVDTGRSSAAAWTGGGWGTRSPAGQKKIHMLKQIHTNADVVGSRSCFLAFI